MIIEPRQRGHVRGRGLFMEGSPSRARTGPSARGHGQSQNALICGITLPRAAEAGREPLNRPANALVKSLTNAFVIS